MNNAIAQPIHANISYPLGVKLVNILGSKKTTTEAINKNWPNRIPMLELFCLWTFFSDSPCESCSALSCEITMPRSD